MIFRPELVRAITLGKKTETRRPVKGDEQCRYKPRRSYAVQPGRGRPAVLRILVTDVQQALLGDVDFDAARAEGFRTRDELCAYWVRLHDKAWVERQEVTTGEDDIDRHLTDEDLAARFDATHAARPVWVIRFEPSREDIPRLLAARPGSARSDYVSNPAQAAAGEPEAVTGQDLERLARKGEMTSVHWRVLEATNTELEAQIRAIDERVQAARLKAPTIGVDVSREVFKVRSVQAAGRPLDVVERWVEALERKAHTLDSRRWRERRRVPAGQRRAA